MFPLLLWLLGSSKADLQLNYNYVVEITFMPNYCIFHYPCDISITVP